MFILPEMFLVEILCKLGAGRHNLLEDCLLRVKRVVLLKERNLDVLEEHDLSARVRLILTCQNPHERCLTGTIRSNESDLVALIDVESDLFEENLRTVAL